MYYTKEAYIRFTGPHRPNITVTLVAQSFGDFLPILYFNGTSSQA